MKYVCGIDIGSQSCSGCVTRPDKRVMVKPITIALTKEGWKVMEEKLAQLGAAPSQIVIGMEATSRYHENLYHELEQRGYQMRLLHPGQTHQYHQQQGRLTKTDRLDAMTIARVLLGGEARVGYIPDEQVATYRELVRLHTQSLVRRLPAIRTRSRSWWWCFFPSLARSRHDPCGQGALAVLKAYPDAQAVAQAGVEAVYQVVRAVPAAHFGRPTAKKLVAAAQVSSSSGRAVSGRASSLRILCDQLEHTQANLKRLEEELEHLITMDPSTKGEAPDARAGSQVGGGLTRGTRGSRSLCLHGSGGGLRWHGYRDQREWEV